METVQFEIRVPHHESAGTSKTQLQDKNGSTKTSLPIILLLEKVAMAVKAE